MNFKKIREAMTEEALSLEYALRSIEAAEIGDLARATKLSEIQAAWILEQMSCTEIVKCDCQGKYSLTALYKSNLN